MVENQIESFTECSATLGEAVLVPLSCKMSWELNKPSSVTKSGIGWKQIYFVEPMTTAFIDRFLLSMYSVYEVPFRYLFRFQFCCFVTIGNRYDAI